ncbi:MAG: hypothetical protein ABRQ28_06760, partial [Smithellaceae bacterium]
TLAHSRNRCFQGVIGLPQLTILYSKNSLFQGAAHINMNFNIIIQGVLNVRRSDEGGSATQHPAFLRGRRN